MRVVLKPLPAPLLQSQLKKMPDMISNTHRIGLYPNPIVPEAFESIKIHLTITSSKGNTPTLRHELLKYVDNLRDMIKNCIENNYINEEVQDDTKIEQ